MPPFPSRIKAALSAPALVSLDPQDGAAPMPHQLEESPRAVGYL
jgi:hypothetical protein